jgi:hypothetical protein
MRHKAANVGFQRAADSLEIAMAQMRVFPSANFNFRNILVILSRILIVNRIFIIEKYIISDYSTFSPIDIVEIGTDCRFW